MSIGARVWVGVLVSSLVFGGCGSGTSGFPAGSERGPCYGNGTCDPGLSCMSDVCVRPAGADTAGDPGMSWDVPPADDVLDTISVPDGCTPSCTGRQCGSNGCGGSCGDCPDGKTCSDAGACVATCADDGHCDADCSDDPDCQPTAARLRLIDFQQNGSNLQVFVSITDAASGRPIGGLEGRIRVLENGTPLSVESALAVTPRPEANGWITLVLLDTSYSILSNNSLPLLAEAVRNFAYDRVDKDSEIQRVAIAAFDGVGARWIPFQDDAAERPLTLRTRGQVDDAIRYLLHPECADATDCGTVPDAWGRPDCVAGRCIDKSTNLYWSVVQGIDAVVGREGTESALGVPRGLAIVVLTDGSDQAGQMSLSDVLAHASTKRAHLFAVGIEGELDVSTLESLGRDGAVMVPNVSGVQAGLDEVGETLSRIGQGIYLVSYCTPKRGGQHTITVRIEGLEGELTLPFSATGEAACDPSLAAQECSGLDCGHSASDFWCGACKGSESCFDGSCAPSWIPAGGWRPSYDKYLYEAGGRFWFGMQDAGWRVSDDAVTWTAIPTPPFETGWMEDRFFLAKDGRVFVFQNASVWSSADGASWDPVITEGPWSSEGSMHLVILHDNQFWAAFHSGQMEDSTSWWRSANGRDWTRVGTTSAFAGSRMTAQSLGGKIWVVGNRIFSSTNALDWETHDGLDLEDGRWSSCVAGNRIWMQYRSVVSSAQPQTLLATLSADGTLTTMPPSLDLKEGRLVGQSGGRVWAINPLAESGSLSWRPLP